MTFKEIEQKYEEKFKNNPFVKKWKEKLQANKN